MKRTRLSRKGSKARKDRLPEEVYRNVTIGKPYVWHGIRTWDVEGESNYHGLGFFRFSGTEFLMKIHHAMEVHPEAFREIWGMVAKKYGLTEYDWSFIRDESDPEQIKKYLVIVSKYHKGKFPWEK
jgi:hypothetical protein